MPEWWTWADWLVLAVMCGWAPALIACLWWAERPLRQRSET
jgi:hypothetical protein